MLKIYGLELHKADAMFLTAHCCMLLFWFVVSVMQCCEVQFWKEEQYIWGYFKSSRQAVNFSICFYSEKLLGMDTVGSFPKIKLPIVSFYIMPQF